MAEVSAEGARRRLVRPEPRPEGALGLAGRGRGLGARGARGGLARRFRSVGPPRIAALRCALHAGDAAKLGDTGTRLAP